MVDEEKLERVMKFMGFEEKQNGFFEIGNNNIQISTIQKILESEGFKKSTNEWMGRQPELININKLKGIVDAYNIIK